MASPRSKWGRPEPVDVDELRRVAELETATTSVRAAELELERAKGAVRKAQTWETHAKGALVVAMCVQKALERKAPT